jgi:prophage maintenance system killer protein
MEVAAEALAMLRRRVKEGETPAPESDLADIAACDAAGVAWRHQFVDEDNRTAFVVLALFL